MNNGDPLTNLALNLQARDLSEFDQTLQTLGVAANGKKGVAALPVVLHGSLVISLAGVDLIYVGLNVIITSVETARRSLPRSRERQS